MNIILKENVENLGKIGDLVKVKPGYARNYLIPGQKAIEATVRNVRQLEHQKKLVQDRIYRNLNDAEVLAKRIEALSVTLSQRVGENDRLFGSVTSMNIAAALQEEGIEIDKRQIQLEEQIKQLGVYTVPIKLHSEVIANLKVWVVEEK